MDDRILLTTDEAARALHVSRARIYEWLTAGAIPSVKLGASRRISVEALKRFVDEHETSGREDQGGAQ